MINPDFSRDLLFTAALFGFVTFVWTGWGQERPPSTAWRFVLGICALAGAALAGLSLPRLIRGWGDPTAVVVGGPAWTAYLVVFAIEVVAIVVAAIWLSRTGRSEFIAPAVLAVVGLHFVPLAWVFGQPIMLLAGVLLTGAAILAAVLPRTKAAPSFWCGILSAPVFLAVGTASVLAA